MDFKSFELIGYYVYLEILYQVNLLVNMFIWRFYTKDIILFRIC
jgi:hypothetical protein